jgi:hypothetical protein
MPPFNSAVFEQDHVVDEFLGKSLFSGNTQSNQTNDQNTAAEHKTFTQVIQHTLIEHMIKSHIKTINQEELSEQYRSRTI